MSENTEPDAALKKGSAPISNKRILYLMGVVVLLGSILCFSFISGLFGFGFLLGGVLSFINYYWLKASLKKVFEEAEEGVRPRVSATRYFLRYLVLGLVLALIFLTRTVPVAAVILGLTSFAFAVLFEAFIRIFSTVFKQKEI